MIPALAAGLVAYALIPHPQRAAPIHIAKGEMKPPRQLARMAATSPLRPIVLRGDAAELGSGAAGPATTVDRPAEPAHLSIPELDVHADIDGRKLLLLLPVLVRSCAKPIQLSDKRGLQVVIATELVAAAVGQPRIDRGGHAEFVPRGCRGPKILVQREIAVDTAGQRRGQRHTRREFLLQTA